MNVMLSINASRKRCVILMIINLLYNDISRSRKMLVIFIISTINDMRGGARLYSGSIYEPPQRHLFHGFKETAAFAEMAHGPWQILRRSAAEEI